MSAATTLYMSASSSVSEASYCNVISQVPPRSIKFIEGSFDRYFEMCVSQARGAHDVLWKIWARFSVKMFVAACYS